MNLKINLVEFSSWDNVLPLVSGYLITYAQKDVQIASNCSFEIFTAAIPIDACRTAEVLAESQSTVYAFSCYMWNIKAVRNVLDQLVLLRPDAHIILGGPQVMNHAAKYIPPGRDHIVICNGEGEETFHQYLRQILSGQPDFRQVPGITYWDGESFATTERAARIADLDEIPSPFQDDIFEPGKYTNAILETNRGCPFSCGFCYWGAATNSKVHSFSTERVRRDIRWIAEHGYLNIFIVDANWGITARDVDLTSYIVACHNETGYPIMVYMAAAKNKPERVAAIAETFVRGGLMACQPISLQTVTDRALDLVKRKNIKEVTYTSLQQILRQKEISSYVELIWPLPGETLQTFKDGITRLCRSKADGIIVFPHLLLHNTPIFQEQQFHGIQMRELETESGEAQVVISTHWVTEQECAMGHWIYYGILVLYNLRGLYFLANYLDSAGIVAFADLFVEVARFITMQPGNPVASFLRQGMNDIAQYDMLFTGKITHLMLHELRKQFDALLIDFASSQPWWSEAQARATFELDLLARPYVYDEPIRLPPYEFEFLKVLNYDDDGIELEIGDDLLALISSLEQIGGAADHHGSRLRLSSNNGKKLPYSAARGFTQNAHYCHAMIFRIRDILPRWYWTDSIIMNSVR